MLIASGCPFDVRSRFSPLNLIPRTRNAELTSGLSSPLFRLPEAGREGKVDRATRTKLGGLTFRKLTKDVADGGLPSAVKTHANLAAVAEMVKNMVEGQ